MGSETLSHKKITYFLRATSVPWLTRYTKYHHTEVYLIVDP